MTDLRQVCTDMHQAAQHQYLIEQCVTNESNRKLPPTALEQIARKCGPLMPLSDARTCARELGLQVQDPPPVKHPPVTVITVPQPRSCTSACDQQYINEAYTQQQWEACTNACFPGTTEALKRTDQIEQRQAARRSLNIWGKFRLRLGVDVAQRHSEFDGAFTQWNANNPKAAVDETGTIDRGWRVGAEIALTTGPGLTRLPGTNILFRGTLFAISVFGTDELGFDVSGDMYTSTYRPFWEPDPLITHNYTNVGERYEKADNTPWTLLDFEFQIPFFERNFFEIGASYIDQDTLWWKNSNPMIIMPANLHIGLNWQVQGTPITVADRILDVADMAFMLSSYTMLGVRLNIGEYNLFPAQKGADFCHQVSNNCGSEESRTDAASTSTAADQGFSYGQTSKPSNTLLYNDHDPGVTGYGAVPMSDYSDTAETFQLSLAAHLFGEQQWSGGGIAYRAFANYFPIWNKLEAGGQVSGAIRLGRAFEWYISAEGRKLWSFEDDGNILLPDDGYEFRVRSGLDFRFSELF